MPSPAALIKHMESDKVLSQVYMHVGVRKPASCPLDVTAKEDFIKVWRSKQLETPGTGRKSFKKTKRSSNILGYINSAPFSLLPFYPLFFQNTFSPLFSVESEREMEKSLCSESHLHSHLHTLL